MNDDMLELLESIEEEIVFNSIIFDIDASKWKTLDKLRRAIIDMKKAD